jgi:hypothetical protein
LSVVELNIGVPPTREPQFSVMPLIINDEFTPNVMPKWMRIREKLKVKRLPNTKNNAAVMPAMRALSPSTTLKKLYKTHEIQTIIQKGSLESQ